jgi:hypothetical protein
MKKQSQFKPNLTQIKSKTNPITNGTPAEKISLRRIISKKIFYRIVRYSLFAVT